MAIDNKHAGSYVKMIQKYIYCWFVYITQSAVLLRETSGADTDYPSGAPEFTPDF
jgi:hypothetical protein